MRPTLSPRHLAAALPILAALGLLAAAPVAAHGPAPSEPPSVRTLLLDWTVEPFVALPLLSAALLWAWAVRRVDARHPRNPVPRRRSVAFFGGLGAIALALLSGIGAYDTTLFSIHMIQHILLALVAAPLVVYAAPITLLLRVAAPETRRRRILPLLHSRALRVLAHPVVAWVLFAAVMWGSHFSPLFNAALEDRLIHEIEHALFFGVALLFWWPAVGADPAPWRMPEPVRALYVFLQMPQNTFLAVAITFAGAPLYEHYATVEAAWPIDPLADQRLAGGIMWLLGDAIFLAAVLILVAAWMRREERETAAADRRADAARAGLRDREARLAARLAADREER